MPPITHLSKKKEAMEPYPTSSLAGAHLDPVAFVNTHNPPPLTIENLGPSPQDI